MMTNISLLSVKYFCSFVEITSCIPLIAIKQRISLIEEFSPTVKKLSFNGANFITGMENGESVNASQIQGSLNVELVSQKEQYSTSHNDIMTRRMKNRERQRRYRARKRLEADLKKSDVVEQPTSSVAELQPNSVITTWTSRVHCRRDWKKDARRAYVLKNSEASSNGTAITIPVLSSESQTLGLSSGTKADLLVHRESHPEKSLDIVNNITHRTVPGRRDWKAEARKKKT